MLETLIYKKKKNSETDQGQSSYKVIVITKIEINTDNEHAKKMFSQSR